MISAPLTPKSPKHGGLLTFHTRKQEYPPRVSISVPYWFYLGF